MKTDPNAHNLDAIEAVAIAQEKIEKAREVQLDVALQKHQETMAETFAKVLKDVFGAGPDDAAVLIHRVPLICQKIIAIENSLQALTSLINRFLWGLLSLSGVGFLGLIGWALYKLADH